VQVVRAVNAPGRLPCGLNCRQKHRHKCRKDRNDKHKLDNCHSANRERSTSASSDAQAIALKIDLDFSHPMVPEIGRCDALNEWLILFAWLELRQSNYNASSAK
jgi:hypothetical protein